MCLFWFSCSCYPSSDAPFRNVRFMVSWRELSFCDSICQTLRFSYLYLYIVCVGWLFSELLVWKLPYSYLSCFNIPFRKCSFKVVIFVTMTGPEIGFSFKMSKKCQNPFFGHFGPAPKKCPKNVKQMSLASTGLATNVKKCQKNVQKMSRDILSTFFLTLFLHFKNFKGL